MLVFLRIAVVAVISWLASAVAIYHLAVWLAPPRTLDGHPVMPIGQVFIAGFGATVLAGALIVVLIVRHRQRRIGPLR